MNNIDEFLANLPWEVDHAPPPAHKVSEAHYKALDARRMQENMLAEVRDDLAFEQGREARFDDFSVDEELEELFWESLEKHGKNW